jgi:hypothetical protein
MDPFSFGASVLGTLQVVAEASLAVAKYVSTFKDAKRSRQRVIGELTMINTTLLHLKVVVDDLEHNHSRLSSSSPAHWTRLISSLEGEDGALAQCVKTVKDLLAWLQRHGTKDMTLRHRLLWPLHDAVKVEIFLDALERQKSHFSLVFSALSGAMQGQVLMKSEAIVAEQQRVRSEKAEAESRTNYVSSSMRAH